MSSWSGHVELARWVAADRPTIQLEGWFVVTQEMSPAAASIQARQGDRLLGEARWRDRPDVATHFGRGDASHLGWAIELRAWSMGEVVRLVALTTSGAEHPLFSFIPEELPGRGPWLGDYSAWAARYDIVPSPSPSPDERGPLFSILLPVYNPPVGFLEACLRSVRRQQHDRWELIAVDDSSTNPEVPACLRQAAARDQRIRLIQRDANGGIARATNVALEVARGDFAVLVDHDDVLRPHALAAFARRLATEPDLDVLYSDEDKIDASDQRVVPFLKPGYSPEFVRGVMYVGHALCVRTRVARDAGGFDPAYDGIQDYEFLLRVMERTRRVGHVPQILYHWRQSPSSSALHGNVKGDMDARQLAAVQSHLRRCGDQRKATALGGHRVRLTAVTFPSRVVVRYESGADPVEQLWSNLAGHDAEVIVLADDTITEAPAAALDQLAALAALPDSGCVAPVLVAPDGRVLEAGRTWHRTGMTPLMTGFDRHGDGYNGSLLCSREVGAVSPSCFAIRLAVAIRVAGDFPAGRSWPAFLGQIEQLGLFHRCCAVAQIGTARTAPDLAASEPRSGTDLFFNRQFDSKRGDYTLANPPSPSAGQKLHWHLDQLPEHTSADGGVEVVGWCFSEDARPVVVRLTVDEVTWSARSDLPRPDVAVAHPGLTNGDCGFALRVRVGSGRHTLLVDARCEGGTPTVLARQTVVVPALAGLRRALAGSAPRLIRFQLPAGPVGRAQTVRAEKYPIGLVAGTAFRPRLAIVTPCYNHARFVPQTMHSVLGQRGVAVDYVIQDGASSDGSREVIARIAAGEVAPGQPTQTAGSDEPRPRVTNWASEPDAGQADAIAKGFAKTSGGPDDLMAWINSDDFYVPGALGFVADWMARHPEVDVIYGHRILVDEQSREVGRWFLPRHDDEVLRLNDFVPQETMFWRRRIWNGVDGLDTSFQFAMDWDLLLRFQAAGAKIVRVPYFLACFRIHAAQKTSAAMHSIGQAEIDRLRARTYGREISPQELENHPRLLRYLRRSAWHELCWNWGIRLP